MIRSINPAFGDTDPSVTFESVEEMAAAILACGPEFSLPEDGLREGRDYSALSVAKSLESLDAAEAMDRANKLCPESRRDQNWEMGATTWEFEDGSQLQICGTLVKELLPHDTGNSIQSVTVHR